MTASQRRQQIETMLDDDPQDSFLRYALAMELRKEGDLTTSIERMRTLIDGDPPFVPAFLMSAQQLVELRRIDEASAILRDGIQQARNQGETHAAAEMAELLTRLGKVSQ